MSTVRMQEHPMQTGHALHLRNISQRFGAVVAANGIDLDIQPGELVSLLGPSGCGKTTLLKIIAGFQRQSSGDVLVDGRSISHLPPNARQIGIVFPELRAVSAHDGGPEHRLWAAGRGPIEDRCRRDRRRDARCRSDAAVPRSAAAAALGRAAAARRACPVPRDPPAHPVARRAVQRARQESPARHADRDQAAAAPVGHHHHPRHA